MLQGIQNMCGTRRIKDGTLQVIAAGADNAWNTQVRSSIGSDVACLRQKISVEYIKRLRLMFRDQKFKPIYQRIIQAFARAEARHLESARGQSPRFRGRQVPCRRQDAYFMPSRDQQAR